MKNLSNTEAELKKSVTYKKVCISCKIVFHLCFTIVLLQEKDVQHTCAKMNPLSKVTLKGGLQAGEFTDVGKVTNLAQCYDVCCQQENCDLAFMLGQNCFSVQCKDKRLCTTIPAQPSIFNPQIAYVTKRERTGLLKSGLSSHCQSCFLLPLSKKSLASRI